MSDTQSLPLPSSRARALISYFWITTFSVVAAQYALQNVKSIIELHGMRNAFGYLGISFIFLLTLFRFSVGNLLHIRSLEENTCLPRVWGLDFSVIFSECLIFVLMGMFTFGNDIVFLKLFMVLCFLDVAWILAMLPDYVKKKRPEPLPWAWGLLNIVGAAYLGSAIWIHTPFSFTGEYGPPLFVVWFFASFIVDVLLIDQYKLLHKEVSLEVNSNHTSKLTKSSGQKT